MQGRRGNPPIRVVVRLPEGVAEPLAVDPKIDVCRQQGRSRPYHLGPTQLLDETGHSGGSPLSPTSTEADLRHRLEGNEEAPPGQERFVKLHQVVGRPEQVGTEDVGVDDDSRRPRDHSLPGDGSEELCFFLVAEVIKDRLQ